ncbi:MAG: tetratricopeptide repeat protein [Bacteroidia bacterium]|nr:tetratricopeptide repeat protein [Bacteroidia bacterium]MCX7764728.1 tetratricopeptide repeat protein [Bacteroidia bacterium]
MQRSWPLILALGLWGCGAERQNAIARTWHTFVSYFNGYYHADQRFRQSQREIELHTPDPAEGYIRVFPLVDPSIARSHYSRLEEAAKKCEVIIFRHKNGRYIDDSRTLIGQTWVLRSNLPNAELNFNYVLNAFPNTPLRAKLYWWQAYAALHEDNPYRAETRLTEALNLPGKQLKPYKAEIEALLAQTLIAKGQPELARPFLERSVKHLDTRLRRARAYYLLGQLYLAEKKYDLAEAAFRKVYRLNVTNGLTFQSQFQLSLLRGTKDPRLVRRLEKMAHSARYEDYRDQIYYRIGQMYEEKGQYEAALAAYKKAGSAGQSPARALAHYAAGTIYFERMNNLSAAQKHFDTAAALIPEKHPRAPEIKALQARFKEYAELKARLYTADSLLLLAEMAPEAQERAIEAYIQAEVLRRAAEKARTQQENANNPLPPNPFLQSQNFGAGGRGSGFYFDNPIQVSNGKQEFIRLWGERPDEDHWRRRNKATVIAGREEEKKVKKELSDSTAAVEWPDDPSQLTPQRINTLKKRLLATIPRSPAQKRAMEDTLIGAALMLAQVYLEAFARKDSAERLYSWLRKRLPHRSEAQIPALYGLYVIYSGTPEAEPYKKELLEKYPDSEYAKLLRSGGRLAQTSSEPYLDIHQALLERYEEGEYQTVVSFGEATQPRWKGTPSEPQILYLLGAAYIHLGEADKAKPYLSQLVQSYPQAACTPLAQKLLQRLDKGQTQLVAESQPEPSTPPPSSPSSPNVSGFTLQSRAGEAILVILLVPKDKITSDALKQNLSHTHQQYYGDQKLSLTVFLYNNSHHLAYIAQFSDYRSAMAYIQTIENEAWFKELGVKAPQDFFPISQANFRVAFTQRRMHDYAAFFAQNKESFR